MGYLKGHYGSPQMFCKGYLRNLLNRMEITKRAWNVECEVEDSYPDSFSSYQG